MTKHYVTPAPVDSPQGDKPRSYYRPWMGILTIVMIVALLAGFWSFSEHLIGTLERQAQRISSLQSHIRFQEEILNLVQVAGPDHVTLNGTPSFPEVSARIYLDRKREEAAVVITNAPPKSGGDFQLWILDNTSVVSGHVVRTTGEEEVWGLASLNGIRKRTQGFLVLTLEPLGGSSEPSQQILARGALR